MAAVVKDMGLPSSAPRSLAAASPTEAAAVKLSLPTACLAAISLACLSLDSLPDRIFATAKLTVAAVVNDMGFVVPMGWPIPAGQSCCRGLPKTTGRRPASNLEEVEGEGLYAGGGSGGGAS